MSARYIGSGPYCYANCLAMALADGTDPGLLEVLTGSPFGLELLAGRRPLFNPLGWDPGIGIDAALDLLGWSCERSGGGDADAALERLRGATACGPVLAGPVEMGLLSHQPGAAGAIGADHYVMVVGADQDLVRFHDPHGHPYATMPAADFAAAWRADSIGYPHAQYTMRTGFRRTRQVAALDALRAAIPAAISWLDGKPAQAPPPARWAPARPPWPWPAWPRQAWPASSVKTWHGSPSAPASGAWPTPSTGAVKRPLPERGGPES